MKLNIFLELFLAILAQNVQFVLENNYDQAQSYAMQCNKIPVGGVDQICDLLISFFVLSILNLGVKKLYSTCINLLIPALILHLVFSVRALFIQVIYF